jgi:hypothetical protein
METAATSLCRGRTARWHFRRRRTLKSPRHLSGSSLKPSAERTARGAVTFPFARDGEQGKQAFHPLAFALRAANLSLLHFLPSHQVFKAMPTVLTAKLKDGHARPSPPLQTFDRPCANPSRKCRSFRSARPTWEASRLAGKSRRQGNPTAPTVLASLDASYRESAPQFCHNPCHTFERRWDGDLPCPSSPC